MEYLSSVVGSILIPLFAVFLIATLGYALGGIKIKGISLGTAGVLDYGRTGLGERGGSLELCG